MEITAAEKIEIEKSRILTIIKGKESLESLTVAQLAEEYSTRYKCAIACYKAEFVSVEAFLKYACGVNIMPFITDSTSNRQTLYATPLFLSSSLNPKNGEN
jgi:hypothetical protein